MAEKCSNVEWARENGTSVEWARGMWVCYEDCAACRTFGEDPNG